MSAGTIDVYDTGPSKELDAEFDAIYRPIDRGILGWRLFIIHKENAGKFANVKKQEDLKAFTAGQGLGWNDIKTLEASGLKVVTAPNIENLVKMVEGKRFDFFPLGSNEAFGILEQFGKGAMSSKSTRASRWSTPGPASSLSRKATPN